MSYWISCRWVISCWKSECSDGAQVTAVRGIWEQTVANGRGYWRSGVRSQSMSASWEEPSVGAVSCCWVLQEPPALPGTHGNPAEF